jgi:hypothetical protein
MDNACYKSCPTNNPHLTRAGKLLGLFVKITVSAIILFAAYEQFLK